MTQDVFLNDKRSFKECFVKLRTPEGKLLYPKSYMKVINKLGLGVKYDLMVLETLLYSAKTLENSLYALNVSSTSLRNEKFLKTTKELLKDAKIKVMFILSETEYFSHISRYNSILSSLQRSGVFIAIDRLGTIHTSFLYLRELNIDFVRFDTYYSSEERIIENRVIIDGFNLMAEGRGIKTWMKNIENSETLEIAKTLNIDYLQGKELSSLEPIYETKI
jgi:EAL domain-containing protein (putative c-di-GMP-specific phosphodiesterase class I)